MLDFVQVLTVVECSADVKTIVNIVKGILGIIQFAVPVLLIVMGTIDLGKAVMSSDEKEIKGAVTKLSKRAIAAIAVFLVGALVMMVMGMLSKESVSDGGFVACWNGTTSAGGTGGAGGTCDPNAKPTGVCDQHDSSITYKCVGGEWKCSQ